MDTFQALADPTRRHIVEMLVARGNLSATDIYQKFSVSAPAISQHLKVLRDSKLVVVQKKKQQRIYSVNPKSLKDIERWIHKLNAMWEERFRRLDSVLEEMKRGGGKNE